MRLRRRGAAARIIAGGKGRQSCVLGVQGPVLAAPPPRKEKENGTRPETEFPSKPVFGLLGWKGAESRGKLLS